MRPHPQAGTPTLPPPVLFTAHELERLTGLGEFELRRLNPSYFGCPGHWRLVGHQIVYTAKAILPLADALAQAGYTAGAAALRALGTALAPHATTPNRPNIDLPLDFSRPDKRIPWWRRGSME